MMLTKYQQEKKGRRLKSLMWSEATLKTTILARRYWFNTYRQRRFFIQMIKIK